MQGYRAMSNDGRFRGWALAMTVTAAVHAQTLFNNDLAADLVAQGLGATPGTLTTAFIFVDCRTVLVVNRSDGRVRRLDLRPGEIVEACVVVLDLDIIAAGTDNQSEYGVQAMALHRDFPSNGLVYIRYDRSPTPGQDTPQSEVVLGPNFSASVPTSNVIERFVWDPAANDGLGALLPDRSIHSVTVDTRYHHGGPLVFLPDGTLAAVYGDLRRTTSDGWRRKTAGALLSVNVATGVVQDNATIIRLNDDGSVPIDNPFDPLDPDVPAGAATWFAYGIRNSFGMAVDPVTGNLWTTFNGPATFDAIDLVAPGHNGGWSQVTGPVGHPGRSGSLDNLVALPGSAYSDPEFSWLDTIGVTGIHFLAGSLLGPAWDDVLLAGCVNDGHLWAFQLNAGRDGFLFQTPALQDLVDDRADALEDPVGSDGTEIVLGLGFGGSNTGILAVERGADGWPYVLTAGGDLYRLRNSADLDADGSVGIIDLLQLLGAWGNCPDPCPPACAGDIDQDCTVGLTDFLALLAAWG